MDDLTVSLMILYFLLKSKATQSKSKEWLQLENLQKIKTTELCQVQLFK